MMIMWVGTHPQYSHQYGWGKLRIGWHSLAPLLESPFQTLLAILAHMRFGGQKLSRSNFITNHRKEYETMSGIRPPQLASAAQGVHRTQVRGHRYFRLSANAAVTRSAVVTMVSR